MVSVCYRYLHSYLLVYSPEAEEEQAHESVHPVHLQFPGVQVQAAPAALQEQLALVAQQVMLMVDRE